VKDLINRMLDGTGGTIPRKASVKFYPYRTASIAAPALCKFSRDEMRDLEQKLADIAGVHPDNHTVYAVSNHGGTIYLKFTDSSVFFGLQLREQTALL
jgi:hypothetical protein